MQRQIPPK
jgi:hypothetical protein